MPRKLCLVTGVDEGMFFPLLLLGESLRRHCPELVLHVCGFGLTALGSRGQVRILMTSTLVIGGHPFEATVRMIARPPEALSFQRELMRRAMEAEAAPLIHSGVWR